MNSVWHLNWSRFEIASAFFSWSQDHEYKRTLLIQGNYLMLGFGWMKISMESKEISHFIFKSSHKTSKCWSYLAYSGNSWVDDLREREKGQIKQLTMHTKADNFHSMNQIFFNNIHILYSFIYLYNFFPLFFSLI